MRRRYRIVSIAYSEHFLVSSGVLTLPSYPFLDSLCSADRDKDGYDKLPSADHVARYIPSCILVCDPTVAVIVPSAALVVRMSALQLAMRLLS